MNIAGERKRRANTLRYFKSKGLAEGRDWRWGEVAAWEVPGVVDEGNTIGVNERLVPKDPEALPIMIRSSGVRLLGAPMLAAAMDDGLFPAEMPFVVSGVTP